VRSDRGLYLREDQASYLCAGRDCLQTVGKRDLRPEENKLAADVLGPGFIAPEIAHRLVARSAAFPSASVEVSERTIGGLPSRCVAVTGIRVEAFDKPIRDYRACAAPEQGVLTFFEGTLVDGTRGRVELTAYERSAPEIAFALPVGATVTKVRDFGL